MNERALFTEFWIRESKTTRNVFARIPDGSGYRPDPKSRTAQEIAWQILCEEKMIIDALETGKVEWAPPPTRADHHLSAPDGFDRAADLRAERRRAVTGYPPVNSA